MSSQAPFSPITDLLERSLNINHVYGEPIHSGDTTVVPVAEVMFGFGAGGGRGPEHPGNHESADGKAAEESWKDAQGAGGGAGVKMTPVGALETGPNGTHFIRYRPIGPMLGAAAIGLIVGMLFMKRRN